LLLDNPKGQKEPVKVSRSVENDNNDNKYKNLF